MALSSFMFDGRRALARWDNATIIAYRVIGGSPRRPGWIEPYGGTFTPSELQELDEALVEHVDHELRKWTRRALLDWLKWNDPNGSYSDEDQIRDGYDPLTRDELHELVMDSVRETYETPEEMRALARR